MALQHTPPLHLKATQPVLKSWRYWWTPDVYEWLTDRPSPEDRRVWRFRGKAVTQWFRKSYLNPVGSGCQGEFAGVVRCIEGQDGSNKFLPRSDCVGELDRYFSCMEASKKFTNHWKKEVLPQYKHYLEEYNTTEIKRSSWKQTRNLARFWYGQGKNGSRNTHRVPEEWGNFPYFPEKMFSPEGWDKQRVQEQHNHLRKDAYFPHTQHTWGHHPGMSEHSAWSGKMPDYTPHAGMPGGYIAPPI
eukprot:Hpha_TRINITY_DN23832_c0_g1::TRINITY_DN23832_c0_g1_i1::g.109883::m.109883